jgi:pyruvate/oxaloacetate carboxyltransferase
MFTYKNCLPRRQLLQTHSTQGPPRPHSPQIETSVEAVVEAGVQTAMEAAVVAALLATVTHPPHNSLYQPLKETDIKATLDGPLRSELVQLVHGLQIRATSFCYHLSAILSYLGTLCL